MFKDSAHRTTEIMRLCISCEVGGAVHSLYNVRKSVFLASTFLPGLWLQRHALSKEHNTRSATQKIPRLLLNEISPHRLQRNHPLDSVLSYMNLINTLITISWRSILIFAPIYVNVYQVLSSLQRFSNYKVTYFPHLSNTWYMRSLPDPYPNVHFHLRNIHRSMITQFASKPFVRNLSTTWTI
jgi:hypothetical protein